MYSTDVKYFVDETQFYSPLFELHVKAFYFLRKVVFFVIIMTMLVIAPVNVLQL